MRKKLIIPAVILTLSVILTYGGLKIYNKDTGLFSNDKHYSWHYKITIEVETPEGIKTDSAVRKVDVYKKATQWSKINQKWIYSTKHKISGEAVVVDLVKHGVLFSLIDDKAYYDAPNAFNQPLYEKIEALPVGSQKTLTRDLPTIVTFNDLNDPKSVTLIYKNPKSSQGKTNVNHFEKLFGTGVKLKDITLKITDEPITWGEVDKWLPWLNDYKNRGARLSGSNSIAITTNELSDNLGSGSFVRGK